MKKLILTLVLSFCVSAHAHSVQCVKNYDGTVICKRVSGF